jgi:hypothetical protein
MGSVSAVVANLVTLLKFLHHLTSLLVASVVPGILARVLQQYVQASL